MTAHLMFKDIPIWIWAWHGTYALGVGEPVDMVIITMRRRGFPSQQMDRRNGPFMFSY
jgi:hypothetical protein